MSDDICIKHRHFACPECVKDFRELESQVSDLQKQVAEMKLDIQRAVQYLGAPVADYLPSYAIGEYDKKISMATDVLLKTLAQLSDGEKR